MSEQAAAKSVLVVDDDYDIRANIQDILTDLGYRVDAAHDGVSALKLVERSAYDVALLDYKMPGMDGATLYREIKRLRPEIVAILVTAHAGNNGVQEALNAGTWRVLRKPVDVSQLLPLVDAASSQPMILLVDDDHEFCESLWQVLREQNCRVCVAHSEKEGLSKLKQREFQVALVDLKLGLEGDGRKILQEIVTSQPETSMCLVTGASSAQLSLQMAELGASICKKPIDVAEVIELVSNATNH